MLLTTVLLSAAMQAAAPAPAPIMLDPVWQEANGDLMFRDYPVRASAAGEKGKVAFRVVTDGTGLPLACEITRSSGHSQLDQETCALITQHAKFNVIKLVNGMQTVRGNVNWASPNQAADFMNRQNSLRAKMANASAPSSALPTPRFGWKKREKQERNLNGEKLVCKRIPRTDSLSAFETQCRSVRSWEKSNEGEGYWAQLQGRQGTGGNIDR